jgi:hypothetical protein
MEAAGPVRQAVGAEVGDACCGFFGLFSGQTGFWARKKKLLEGSVRVISVFWPALLVEGGRAPALWGTLRSVALGRPRSAVFPSISARSRSFARIDGQPQRDQPWVTGQVPGSGLRPIDDRDGPPDAQIDPLKTRKKA